MALWQICFELIPRGLVEGFDELPAELFESYSDDNSGAGPVFSLPRDYRSRIERLLPPKKGWSENMELWGDEGSDDFTIWHNSSKIESIQVRIDVRKLDDNLLLGILALAHDYNCLLVETRYRKVCQMRLEEFRAFISGHPHSRAMKDPKAWLPVLAEEVRKKDKD